jgi:pSer/pThr/pTyr-binding forkhead associated (FHA) protein
MKLRSKLKANYSKEELEKADILEAYTRLLSGEKLSRKQRKLLHSQRYEEELAPLKKIVDFTHQQSDMMVESIVPSAVVSQRVETNLMNLIKDNPISTPAFAENLQPAYDVEPMGADSQLAQMAYEYDGVKEPILPTQQKRLHVLQMRLVEGDEIGREYRVEIPEIILGRGQDATIRLEDNKVSRDHAQLTVCNGDIYIIDLDSSNGTHVDGKLIEARTQLVIGSQVRLGDSLIVVSDVQSSPPRPQQNVPPEFMITFKELTDNDMAREYTVTMREITIGRGFEAQIRWLDSTGKLSRIHAKLDVYKGDVYIVDLNSSNGTYVDGKKISASHKLSIGTKVKLGGIGIQILSIGS